MTAESLKKLKHELRTPINHIIGYSELLMESAADDGMERLSVLARQIRGAGQVIATTIDRHLLTPADQIGTAEMTLLHDDVLLLLDRLLAHRSVNEEAALLPMYTDDLAKIYAAAEHLKAAIRYEFVLVVREG